MDDFDVFTSKPSTTQDNILSEFENTDDKINNQKDDSSWIIENNPDTAKPSDIPADDGITSSQAPVAFNDDPFGSNEQIDAFPPTAEDILSDNSTTEQAEDKPSYHLFSNEELSPLHAINKKREQEIAAKDAEENTKIEQLSQQAKTDLERWYNERQRQMEQKRQTMKNEENELNARASEKSSKESCDWSKVIRLVDFTDGTQLSKSKRDLTRMKSCIFTAKRLSEKKKLANGI